MTEVPFFAMMPIYFFVFFSSYTDVSTYFLLNISLFLKSLFLKSQLNICV